jgi:mannitol-1-phosphate/altronate dehydrogenase
MPKDICFSLTSCDNVQCNGKIVKAAVLDFASEVDTELAAWIEEYTAFPNSLLDRMTPTTLPKDVDFVKQNLGFKDTAPVVSEDFTQWIIEDDLSKGRPQWEKAGATLLRMTSRMNS